MSNPSPTAALAAQRESRFNALVQERLFVGRRIVDCLSHAPLDLEAFDTLVQVQERLEVSLRAFSRRWPHDLETIFRSEEERRHTPPNRPLDDSSEPCVWCRRHAAPATSSPTGTEAAA